MCVWANCWIDPRGDAAKPPPRGQLAFGAAGLKFLGVGGKSKEARVLYWIASYMIGACIWQAIVCFRNRAPFPFGCAWPVVAWVAVVSAPGPEICNLAGWW